MAVLGLLRGVAAGLGSRSQVSDFWNDQLVANDRQWLFLVLAGIIVSFGLIRISTRLMRSPRTPWWPGSIVSEGGVHVHHLVFGIVLMMIAGTLSFAGFAVVADLRAVRASASAWASA